MTQHPSFYRATANMLCQMCRDNLGNVSVRYNHHNSTQSLFNAIEAQCFICRNVWQEIVEVSDSALYESGDWVPQTYERFLKILQPHFPEEDVFWDFAAERNPPKRNSQPFSVVRICREGRMPALSNLRSSCATASRRCLFEGFNMKRVALASRLSSPQRASPFRPHGQHRRIPTSGHNGCGNA